MRIFSFMVTNPDDRIYLSLSSRKSYFKTITTQPHLDDRIFMVAPVKHLITFADTFG